MSVQVPPAWDRLRVGDRVPAARRTIPQTLVTLLVSLGGYTHPLFTDAIYLQEHSPLSADSGPPLPGEGLLLILGGLAEQSGVFDESVLALLGFDAVTFRRPVFAGETVALEMEVLAKETAPGPARDRGVIVLAWRAVNTTGDALAEATARMLVQVPRPGPGAAVPPR